MFDEEAREYVCDFCGRRFPERYNVKHPGRAAMQHPPKVYGTRNLMALHAHNNFRKHVKACAARSAKKEKPDAK